MMSGYGYAVLENQGLLSWLVSVNLTQTETSIPGNGEFQFRLVCRQIGKIFLVSDLDGPGKFWVVLSHIYMKRGEP